MQLRHLILCTLSSTLLLGEAALAQNYPAKPVRFVAIGPGGSIDFAARVLAQGLTPLLGQQIVVENRHSGFLPSEIVAKAAPDGYTLLVSAGNLWVASLLQNNVPYDVFRDFAPISLTTRAPLILVVHPALPAKSVKELIALAKGKPGVLNYSTAQSGSSSHLAGALFAHMAGINIVRIPFKSGSSRMTSLISGEVQMEVSTPGSVAPYIKSGRERPLAVTTAQPSPLFPGLLTVAATVPGYEYASVGAFLAPARTPAEIVNRLSQEAQRFLKTPEARERFAASGVEAVGTPPDQLAAAIKSETIRLGKVIKDLGIRSEGEGGN